MAVTIRIRLSHFPAWSRELNARLRSPREILNQIGGVLVAASRKSFRDQKLGSFAWPARYPRQSGLKLNVAGAVQDLAKGPTIKARRFQDRPALLDTGLLRGSVTFRVEGDTAVVGSNLPYASLHQGGGESRQPITQTIRDNLNTYLKREGGATRRAEAGKKVKKSKGEVVATFSGEAMRYRLRQLRKRLGRLFKLKELVTKVNRRPFVGIDEATQTKLVRTVERDLPKGIQR